MASISGINGRPVAITPRMIPPSSQQQQQHQRQSHDSAGSGLFSTFLCGGPDGGCLMGSPRKNEVDWDINPTGVYVAVHTKQWELAIERVKLYPREASIWVVRYGNPADTVQTMSTFVDGGATVMSNGMISVATPHSGLPPSNENNMRVGGGPNISIRWRMLPIHAAFLFNAPIEVIQTLIKIYPAGCSAHDDQGMLPLHLAFRNGSSEEIVILLLKVYPEAIERFDHKGRLPSMLAPKDAINYGSTIGEAFVRGPTYYYWASRVATADRMRSEMAMVAKMKQLEEVGHMNTERGKDLLNKTEKQLTEEIEALSVECVEQQERILWYESKYDGAEEKEKVLVDHTNSLAERLRLTSLSEEHLATKLAKLEAQLQNKEMELEETKMSSKEEKGILAARLTQLEQSLIASEYAVKTLTEQLEKEEVEKKNTKSQLEKERELYANQIEASKQCMKELIASSKEDTQELRRQLLAIQGEVQKCDLEERSVREKDSEDLRKQLYVIQAEIARKNNTNATGIELPRSLEDRLDNLQQEVANNTRSLASRVENVTVEAEKRRAILARQRQKSSAATLGEQRVNPSQNDNTHNVVVEENIEEEEEEQLDTYVSTKPVMTKRSGGDTNHEYDDERDDVEDLSYCSDQSLGELTEEQRHALENLDLSGSNDEIKAMLEMVPGLTTHQVQLLVDVATSLAL